MKYVYKPYKLICYECVHHDFHILVTIGKDEKGRPVNIPEWVDECVIGKPIIPGMLECKFLERG